MKHNATITFRSGGTKLTEIDPEKDPPQTIAQRMMGGFIILSDTRWSKPRTLIINLSDVKMVEIEGYPEITND